MRDADGTLMQHCLMINWVRSCFWLRPEASERMRLAVESGAQVLQLCVDNAAVRLPLTYLQAVSNRC